MQLKSNGYQDYRFALAVFIALFIAVVIGKWSSVLSYKLPILLMFSTFILILTLVKPDYSLVLLILLMLLSPEIKIGSVPGRDIVIRIEDLLIVLFFLVWIAKVAINRRLRLITKTPINVWIGLYAVLFVLSTYRGVVTAGVNPLKGTFYILKYLEYFVIFYLAANSIRSKKQYKLFLYALLATFVIVNLYAISQLGVVDRATAPFEGEAGEPNTLGGYQVLMLGIVLGLVLNVESQKAKIILLLITALTIVPFLNTLSRSSYVSIVPMYLVLFAFSKKNRLVLAAVVFILVILIAFFLPKRVRYRIQYTFIPEVTYDAPIQKVLGVEVGPSASARIYSWKISYEKWKKSPYFGYGVTALGFLDSQYIRTFVELGAAGLLAFLFLLISIYRNTLRIYRNSQDKLFKGVALGFLAGHVGMVFHAITANTYVLIRIMEPYWFLAAMVMIIPRLEKQLPQKQEVQQEIHEDYPLNSNFLLRYSGAR